MARVKPDNIEESRSAIYARAIRELIRVRHKVGLTQAEVAERMGTKQSAIAQLEKNGNGAFTLHRYADYALACEHIPCNLCDPEHAREGIQFRLIPLEEARKFTIHHPQWLLTWRRYVRWKCQEIVKELGPPQQCAHTDMVRMHKKWEVSA